MQQLLGYVLGLILTGLAAYGAYEAYSSAMDGQHIQSLQTQVTSMGQQVITQYQRRPGRYDFGALTNAVLISSKIAPQSAINNATVTNPFGGQYEVQGTGGVQTPLNTFSLAADSIPEGDCEQILKTFGQGGGYGGGQLYGYAIIAGVTSMAGAASTTIPEGDTAAEAACKAPGTALTTIQFIFNG